MRTFLLILFLTVNLFAQADIVPALKKIEAGEIAEAKKELKRLQREYPNDGNVKFLDAVLTENGEEALHKYEYVLTNYHENNFADAALYRIFSYYYALGIYNKAEKYLTKLKDDYPDSPYIKAADRTLPSEDFFVRALPEKGNSQPAVTKSKTTQYKYTVQAGAFLNKTNADNLKRKFQAKGIYADTYTKEVGGSLLNIVVIGKFKDKESAKPILAELKKKYRLNGRVILLK